MEQRLNHADEILTRLEAAMDEYEALLEDLRLLDAYLGSPEWHADRRADELNQLPQDLQRGVLSEDGIWNLLERHHEALEQMQEVLENIDKHQTDIL